MRWRAAAAALVVLVATACAEQAPASEARTRINVSAAASLVTAFDRIGADFEARNPEIALTFNHGPSSGLAGQIVQGSRVDVFAAANDETMRIVVDEGEAAGEPVRFARNQLQIAVPAGNPGRVRGLRDFARAELIIALCDKQVPCGKAAVQALAAAGVTAEPDSLEEDVQAVLTKVALGEVDAGLVYRTDVLAAGDDVTGIDLPATAQVSNDYLIVALERSRSPGAAQAFLDHVLSARGQAVLAEAGFRTP